MREPQPRSSPSGFAARARRGRFARTRRIAVLMTIAAGFALSFFSSPASAQAVQRVLVIEVDGPITSVTARYVGDGIRSAERNGYHAVVLEMDTPGGLDTAMRRIVQDILDAQVPVIVYVYPPGGRAASAGAIITYAAHVAAMAPATAIGAATPVGGGGGEDLDAKIVNDAAAYAESLARLRDRDVEFAVASVREGASISSSEALARGVVDHIAPSLFDLLEAIDGQVVRLAPDDRTVVLETRAALVDEYELGFFLRIQKVLADPNLAFLFMSVGTLGLIYELASPGIGIGGVLGVTFIVLGLFGLAVLPVNVVGILFLLIAAALFVAEIFAPGIGIAAAGGAFMLFLSAMFLVDDVPGMELSLLVAAPVAITTAVLVIVAGRLALRSRKAPSTTTGAGPFQGRAVTVRMHGDRPQAFVEGAWWQLRSDVPLRDGQVVEIERMEGLELVVRHEDAVISKQENKT
jgi:membrane-bound serine protease (ClpP class)